MPCWNAVDRTQRCLESVLKWTSFPYEMIVVDNGSRDGTREFLSADFRRRGESSRRTTSGVLSRILLLRNARNRGFAKAINQATARARGKYVVWLNNDAVVTPNWLERLVDCAEKDPAIGIVGPRVHRLGGPQAVERVSYDGLGELALFSEAWGLRNAGCATDVPLLMGCCLCIKRDVLTRVGKVEEGFGLGNYEDYDFCLRARIAGYKLAIAEDVFIHHDYHASFQANGLNFESENLASLEKFRDKWRHWRNSKGMESIAETLAAFKVGRKG